MKTCSKCKIEKDESEFFKNKNNKDGLSRYCKPCLTATIYKDKEKKIAYINQWQKDNHEKAALNKRRHKLKTKYNMTLEDYDKMLEKAGGVCEICGKAEAGRGRKYFCIDHCHKTGRIRGLLCQNCNDFIARFKDDISIIDNAIKYLQSPPIDIENIKEIEFNPPDSSWKCALKKKFNLTPGKYGTILLEQDYKCKICGTYEPEHSYRVFSVDHNHSSGDIRGLLCAHCNEGLGKSLDDIEFLKQAKEYLDVN